ncbi:MAG: response regulator [Alphaproteobacteria bacterium]|nr:response regulator [Alphaproteobacteria bacterium]MBF0249070.1 response regulator [Alphaproteobacteria bacterium]
MFSALDTRSLDTVDILLVDPDRMARSAVRNILIDNGFRRITEGKGMRDIEEKMRIATPDLIISDINLGDGDFSTFVHNLRHHMIGANPFLPVIATAWSPTSDDIRAVVMSGADAIISKPMSANQLLQRIKSLIQARKPFVVTSNYIGPDRGKAGAVVHAKAKPIEVPNTLRAKALGDKDVNLMDLQREIDRCLKQVNLEKLDSHAHQVMQLVDKILPGLKTETVDEATHNQLDHLLFLGEDISRRMVGTKFAHVSELCDTLIDVTKRILDAETAGRAPAAKDIELLRPLAQSIQRGFDESDTSAARAAREISSTVAKK